MTQHVIRALNHYGDEALATWNPADEISTEEARKRFNALVEEGYLTFVPDREGSDTSTRIKKFDPQAATILVFLKSRFVGG